MKKTLLVTCMILVAGCAGQQTRVQQIETACAAATAGLRVIAVGVREGKVTPGQQAVAVAAGDTIAPICGAANPPTLDSLKQTAFDIAIQRIAFIAGGAQ